jgi:glycosyltransferase A (GT-A) superfamily protein (DUF2064 family)
VKALFENKQWGTHAVLRDTIEDINNMDLTYDLLPLLNDIDELKDIRDVDRDFLLP